MKGILKTEEKTDTLHVRVCMLEYKILSFWCPGVTSYMTFGYLPASSHHTQLVSEAILIHTGQFAKANLTREDLIAILLLAWICFHNYQWK